MMPLCYVAIMSILNYFQFLAKYTCTNDKTISNYYAHNFLSKLQFNLSKT